MNTYQIKGFLSILLFIITCSISWAQNTPDIPEANQLTTVTYDMDTGALSKPFPFDKFFTLKVKSKKNELLGQVVLFEMKYNKKGQRIAKISKDQYLKDSNRTYSFDSNSLVYSTSEVETMLDKEPLKGIAADQLIPLKFQFQTKKEVVNRGGFVEVINKSSYATTYTQFAVDYYRSKFTERNTQEIMLIKSLEKYKKAKIKKITFPSEQDTSITEHYYRVLYDDKPFIPEYNLQLNKKDNKGNYSITIPPLKPNKLYEVVLRKKLSNGAIAKFYDLISLMRANPNNFDEHKVFYDSNILTFENEEFKTFTSKYLREFAYKKSFHADYENIIKPLYDVAADLDASITTTITVADTQFIGSKFAANKLNLDLYRQLIRELPKDATPSTILLGQKKFGKKPIDTSQYKDLNLNSIILTYNATKIDSLKSELEKLYLIDTDPRIKQFYTVYFSEIEGILTSNIGKIDTINKPLLALLHKDYAIAAPISANTSAADIKTKNAQYLVADFGVSVGQGRNIKDEFQVIARPHLGLNWHIGGIDKDQRLSQIPKRSTFRHRWSVAIGVTVGAIKEQSYQDLFNGITPTLGLNYRLTQQIRLGGGAMFVREKDPNPIVIRNPVEVIPYISLSFDFSLFSQIGKLATKIF